MVTINNNRPQYFVLPGDTHQTKAVASNFNPSDGNYVAAFLKQSEQSPIQRIGKTFEKLRTQELQARSLLNKASAQIQKKWVNSSGGAIEARIRGSLIPDSAEMKTTQEAKINAIETKAEIKEKRIALKHEINKAGSLEELENLTDSADEKLQGFLTEKGYVASDQHLSGYDLPNYDAEYLSDIKGHKVQLNYDKPSFLQKNISETKSYLHDNRIKGTSKNIINAGLYGAAGLSNALHLVKEGIYKQGAQFTTKGSEEHTTLTRKAAEEKDARRLNNAALSGNAKLADTFNKVNDNRKKTVSEKLLTQGYAETKSPKPGISYTTRKIDDYFSGGTPNPNVAKAAKIVIGIKNLNELAKADMHSGIAHVAKWATDKSPGNRIGSVSSGIQHRHEQARFNALFRKEVNSASLKGDLREKVIEYGLKIPTTKEAVNLNIKKWSGDRLSNEELEASFTNAAKELSAAWPPRGQNDFSAFTELANHYQTEKLALFAFAQSAPPQQVPDKLYTALRCANILQGKEGHNDNVASVASSFLEADEIRNVFSHAGVAITEKSTTDILEAAKWHGLSDRDIPVSVLTAKRPPTAEEKNVHINVRSGNSANIYAEYGMGNEEASALIRNTRILGEKSQQRPLAAQFLDLMDRISAMGAKPFFIDKETKKVDVGKLFTAIEKELFTDVINPEKSFIDPELMKAVKQCVTEGKLDAALLTARRENTYVRA